MTRSRSATVSLLVVAGLLLLPGTALATTVDDVVGDLRDDPVYVDPQAGVQVDADAVRDAIEGADRNVYVAVLPQAAANNSGGTGALTSSIGAGLDQADAILFVVTGSPGNGGTVTGGAGAQAGLGRGEAQQIATSSRGGDATASLVAAVRAADAAAADGPPAGSGVPAGDVTDDGGSGGGGAVLALLALLGIGGGGVLWARGHKRRQQGLREMQGSRADVESLYGRLGADVSNLAAGDDDVARQALADAAERYNATGALMSKADTPGEWAAARRTVVEGLTAARLARTRLGLDPGPEVPPPPGSGPQLQAPQRVQVGDDEYEGSPDYAPGRSHYYGGGYVGGRMVPGGWYGVPFWETMLLGSVLSGGFGGGFGGGYGGYERGYEEGVEDAGDAGGGGDRGGGDWGGLGGGDWGGGGGGDWGGGGWGGGGGGDFGGGGGGGGSW